MITTEYIEEVVAKAQNALRNYAYDISIKELQGESPEYLYRKLYVCCRGVEVLLSDNLLTDREKQIIVDWLFLKGDIGDFSATPFVFSTFTVLEPDELYLPFGQIWIGNSQNIATPRTISGDGTIDHLGVLRVTVTSGIGPGTVNRIPKFNTINTINDSEIYQNGTDIGIGSTTPLAKLHVEVAAASAGYYKSSSTTATHQVILFTRFGNTNSTDRVIVAAKARTSGSATVGISSGIYYQLENDAAVLKDSGAIKSIATAVTAGAESAELQFFYQKAGVIVEGMTLQDTGVLQMDGASAGIFIQTTGNSNSLNITNSGTAGITGVNSTVYSTNTNAAAIAGIMQNDTNNIIHNGLILNKTGLLNPTLGAAGNGVGIRFDADSTTTNQTMGSVAMRWKVATNASRTSETVFYTVNNAGTATENLKLDGVGRLFIKTPNSAPTDGDIDNGTITAYLNEAGNLLTFRVKYAAGTLKTGTVALV